MNAAITSGSTTTAGDYRARAKDAYVATNLFAAGFALVALVGIIHAEATFVPVRVDVRSRPLPPFSLAPMLAPLVGRGARGGAEAAGGPGVVGEGAIAGVRGSF